MGRAPRTKETLPDFLKWRRVTRHPLGFRGLTGSQRTPGFWGATAEVGTLLQKLFNMKYDGTAGVRDYVLRMVDLKTKLQDLSVTIHDACIVH